MIADALELRETDAGRERSARVRWSCGELRVAIEAPREHVVDAPDASPFLPALLLPAMRAGEDLEVDGPVSPALMRGCARAAELYRAWDPRLRIPRLVAAEEVATPSGRLGVACFFSRGVDSTYSAAVPRTHPAELTELVFIDQLEPLHDATVRQREIELASAATSRIGLPLTVVRTNLRELTDRFVYDWEDMAGAGLAFVGLALAAALRTVVVASSDGPHSFGPCGVSPLLDPLFSTESLRVEHDSIALTRVDKVLWLARERRDLARGLKVCYSENRADNCGRCGKCLITMVALAAADALAGANHFPDEVDLDAIAATSAPPIEPRLEWIAAANALDPDRHGELRDAVLAMLTRRVHPRRPGVAATPAFRARHSATIMDLVASAGAPAESRNGGAQLIGLVRAVDEAGWRHQYAAGSLPRGRVAGELGALLTDPEPGTHLLWTQPDGLVVSAGYAPAPPRVSALAAWRWRLAPLAWRGVRIGSRERLGAAVKRARRPAPRSAPSVDRADSRPLGHIYTDDGPDRLPLVSALHPLTGDQLLSNSRWEANDLGYGEPELLGYVAASAPVTGRLGTRQLRVPWASRFGSRVRTTAEPLTEAAPAPRPAPE